MHVRTMRMLDRFLGVPLCWLVGLLSRWRTRPAGSSPPRTILVTKFFGLGSIVLSLPLLERLRREFPASRLLYLSFASHRELLHQLPVPCDIVTIDPSSVFCFVRDSIAAVLRLRRARVDCVLDLEFFSKYSTLLSVLSGSRVRVGYDLPARWRRMNLTHAVPLDRTKHVASVFLDQLGALEVRHEAAVPPPRLFPSAADRLSMERKLGLGGNGVETIVININAGATSLERRWPSERFLDIAERLLHNHATRRIYFSGSADERYYIQRALDSRISIRDRSVNCAGLLTIGEFLALLARSSLLLTNDSGPMHLAAAVGTPVVALFGPESPRFYGPLGTSVIVYNRLPCSPCLNMYNAKLFVCPYNARCMHEISVTRVLHAIDCLLAHVGTYYDTDLISHARSENT